MTNEQQFVTNARAQWEHLVKTSWGMLPATHRAAASALSQAAGVGKSTLIRKMEAIDLARAAGLSQEKIIEMGQRAVMAKFVTDKRNGRTDAQVVLKWMVSPETRNDVLILFERIGTVLKRATSEERWDFILGVFADVTDQEIHHQAGDGDVTHRSQKNG